MHPLIVVDAHLRHVGTRVGDGVVERHVVGVRHPARLLRVVDVGAREVAGRPALDLVADVVLRRDDDGHGHEHDGRDVVVEPVDGVVVGVVPQLLQVHRRQHADEVRHGRRLTLTPTPTLTRPTLTPRARNHSRNKKTASVCVDSVMLVVGKHRSDLLLGAVCQAATSHVGVHRRNFLAPLALLCRDDWPRTLARQTS